MGESGVIGSDTTYTLARIAFGGTDEEFEKFLSWAIGDDYGVKLMQNTPEIWNERHGDIFQMFGSDSVENSIQRMKDAYLKRQTA